MHSKKRNTIEPTVLKSAVSAAREQVLNTSTEQLNESLTLNNSIISIDDEEQMAIPKPNYSAQKPEEVFVLDDSSYPPRRLRLINNFSFVPQLVINENDLLLLDEKCHEIVDATKETIQKWSKEGTYASFVCDQMKKLPVDHAQRVRGASKILYLHYLIAFFKRSMFKRLSGSKFSSNFHLPHRPI